MKTYFKQILFGLILALLAGLFFTQINTAQATGNVTFRGGYYTNISGYTSDVNGNISGSYNADGECSPSLGYCKANKNGSPVSGWNVQKYICKGKFTNCDGNHNSGSVVKGPDYSTAHYIYDTAYPMEYTKCGYTIQLDINSASDGFMTWYSGDCSTTVNVCTGTLTRDVLQNDLILANYPGPFFPDEAIAAYNHAACVAAPTATPTPTSVPTATPTVTPTPVPNATATPTPTSVPTATPVPNVTVTPTPAGTTTIQCPNGVTIVNSNGQNNNSVNCNSVSVSINNTNNNQSSATGGSVTLAGAPAPVVTTQVQAVKELPKTGLPLAAWGLSGMLPVGFGLKKLVSDKDGITKMTAHYIWQQREFLKK